MTFNNRFQARRGKGKFLLIPFAIAAVACLLGAVVMWLWNAILPDLLHVQRIKFWQSVGLLALCRILFGNFNKGGGHHNKRGMMGNGRGQMLREKWTQMTPEERAKFKDEWRARCGNWKRRSE